MLVKLEINYSTLLESRRYFAVTNLALCSFITEDFVSTFFAVISLQELFEIWLLTARKVAH